MSMNVREILERAGHSGLLLELILAAVSDLMPEFDRLAFQIDPDVDAIRRFFYEVSLVRSFVHLALEREGIEEEAAYRRRLLFQTQEDFDNMIREA